MVLRLRDAFVNLCHKTSFGVKVEASSALTPDLSRSRPADALVNSWMGGNPAAFDITVTSLTPCRFMKQVSWQEQPLDWQSKGSTRIMNLSVTLLEGTASLLLWRAMGTGS